MSEAQDQVAEVEAEAAAEETPKPDHLTITVRGKEWKIPPSPTLNYLAGVSDLTAAEEDDDDGAKLRATIAISRSLLGKQFRRFGDTDAAVMGELFDEAHAAYGGESGN